MTGKSFDIFHNDQNLALSSAVTPSKENMGAVESRQAVSHKRNDDDPSLDTQQLFEDTGKYAGMFNDIAQDFNLELLSVDIANQASVKNFGDQLAHRGIETGHSIAADLVDNENDGSPVVMQYFSGDDASGRTHHIAAISYDSSHNGLLKEVFASFGKTFGETANEAVENAIWMHETMHSIVKNSEQIGLESWKQALNGNFTAYDDWSNSVHGQLSHPEVKARIDSEIGKLRLIFEKAAQGQQVSYDASGFLENVRALQNTDEYTNYQENMADGFMSIKFLQDGVGIAKAVGDSRAERAHFDAIHDSSAGQRAIAENLKTEDLRGKNAIELASITAVTVQSAMGFRPASAPVNNGIDDGLEEIAPQPKTDVA